MSTFKVIIAGSRDFLDFKTMVSYCDHLLKNVNDKNIEIVSGTAKGADKLGEEYAKLRGYAIKQFTADWNKFGKKAGHMRNSDMATYGDALIAFWNGSSKGTEGMIDVAHSKGLNVRVKIF